MRVPWELKQFTDAFFLSRANEFDLTEASGCGQYIEALVIEAQNKGWEQVGHLRKFGSQTQYNGHAVDAIAYDFGGNLAHAVDLIVNAEAKPPYSSNHRPPSVGFGEDTVTIYETNKVWYLIDENDNGNSDSGGNNTIPWQPYWGDPASDKITRALFYDFFRRPESYNPGMGRWLNRCLHSAFLGPKGIPLGVDGALDKHRPEWCEALGGLDPNIPVPDDFFSEYK